MATIQEALQAALQQHRIGNLAQAEQLYRQILQVQPEQVDALHLLGLVCQRTGRLDQAVEYIRQALHLKPDFAEAHSNLGIALRQTGRLDEAVASYQQALRLRPDNAEAHNNLGVALREQKRFDEAVRCYQQALHLKPTYAEAFNNLGVALADLGKLDDAIAACRQSLALKPDHAEAFNNLGNTLRRQGKLDEAVASFRKALRLRPQHADTLYNLGVAFAEQGKPEEAVASYQQALLVKPEHAEAHNNLGVVLTELRRLDEAVPVLERAVRLRPAYPEALNNLGNALKERGRLPEALACFREALRLKPDFAAACINQGAALLEQGKPEEAVTSYRQALWLRPDYVEALSNLGTALLELGQVDEAVARCQEALRLRPDHPEAVNNLGAALRGQGKLAEAAACYRQALRLKPDYPEALINLGVALTDQGNLDEAVACYQQALQTPPRDGSFHATAHMNRAMVWLLKGDFERGWAEYEWRWQCKGAQERPFRQPRWEGLPLGGKTILLHAEQGLGDAIQFVRYAALVKERGGRVIVEAPRPLLTLLATCPGIDELVAWGSALPLFDVHAPLLSLPGIFRTTRETIPADVPYLFADAASAKRWREELASLSGFKVGVVWQGNPKHKGDRWRSLPLAQLAGLARVPGVRLISLQKGPGAEQLAALQGRGDVTELAPLREEEWTFAVMAAVLAGLDLVVSVDTAAAHLAGALGVPVWVLVPFAPDWRWLLGRDDSPWYPTLRLFRQERPGDWPGVLDRVAKALEEQAQSNRSSPPAVTSAPARRAVLARIVGLEKPPAPDPAGALLDQGVALAQQGRPDEAAARFREAARTRPGYAEAHYNLGIVLAQQGRLDEAVASYRQALAVKPDYAPAHVNLGVVLGRQKKTAEAVACYREALRLQPDSAEAHINLGTALLDQDRVDEAAASLQQAVRLAPDRAEVHYNLATLLSRQGRFGEAEASLRQALTLRLDYPDAHVNLANALLDQGRIEAAAATLRHLLRLRPDHADAHKNLAIALLLHGDFEHGWPEYEWRWRTKDMVPRSFAQPMWDGSALAGRTILLHAEQGLGDTIQFIRYASLVKERGGRVIVDCQPALLRLLEGVAGVDQLIGRGAPLPPFDVHAPLLSLPGILGTSIDSVPAKVPYLQANAALREKWRAEIGSINGFKIGVVWQGSPAHLEDRRRSVPLAEFAPLARLPGVRLISLQKGPGPEQLAALEGRFDVHDLNGRLDETTGPFLDTAAVMTLLDLVVTSDTAAAHLAGALGVPVWVALASTADWRWLRDRDDSPWYPTMRLFRQERPGDWADVFGRMARALEERRRPARQLQPVLAEMAPGELFDKIAILEIKNERIADAAKLRNVRVELADLAAARDRAIDGSPELDRLAAELKTVNEALWRIEDDIRDCERRKDFGPTFVELARAVYHQNDRRAAVKRRINDLLGSRIIEEKSYQAY